MSINAEPANFNSKSKAREAYRAATTEALKVFLSTIDEAKVTRMCATTMADESYEASHTKAREILKAANAKALERLLLA